MKKDKKTDLFSGLSSVPTFEAPDVTPEQAKIIADQASKKPTMLDRALESGADYSRRMIGNKIMPGYAEAIVKAEQERAANPNKPFVHYEAPQKQKIWLAIDPGKNGGLCALSHDNIIDKWIIPLLGDDIDINGLYTIMNDLIEHYTVTVILEEVHSIFGSSAASNFTFGYVCGVIEAVVVSHKLRFIKVQPKTWQAEIWDNHDKSYKVKKPDQKKPSIDTKFTSLKAAIRLFPGVDMRKSQKASVAHDGIVDALLLGEYARRKNL